MKKQPNILFILSDQHRYDCTGYANDYPVKTPNLDRLAQDGLCFNRAYTPIPLCCPARQSLMTGRRAESLGCYWNFNITLDIPGLDPKEYAWPRDLKNAGYRCGYVGKWHVNQFHNPTEFGFDDYISDWEYKKFRQEKYPNSDMGHDRMGAVDSVPLEDTRTHWQAKLVQNLIEQYTEEGKPWHIRLDFKEPHLPCQPTKEFADRYNPKDIPIWRSFSDTFQNKPYIQKQQLYNWGIENYTWEDWSHYVARYYAIISQMDDAIGYVLSTLDQLGIANDTMVIYSTDHGDMGGGHQMMDKHYVLYQDIVHIPMIIRWPGVIEKGSVNNEFVYQSLDLPPTIMEAVGLTPPESFHGRSLMPLLRGEKVSDWRQEVVSTYNGQQFGLYTQRMIFDGRFKYIWNLTDMDELYDLEEDPDELDNRIYKESYKAIISNLRKKLYEVLVKEGDGLVKGNWLKNQLLYDKKL